MYERKNGRLMPSKIERRIHWPKKVEVRGDDGKVPILQGHAAVYETWSPVYWGFKEIIRAGAFTKTLKDGADVLASRNHNIDHLLGRVANKTLVLREDDQGLYDEIYPDMRVQHAADTVHMIERGDISQQSFMFEVIKERWLFSEDDEPDERELLEMKLYEVGPVTAAWYPTTDISLGERSLSHIEDAAKEGNAHARALWERVQRSEPDHFEHSQEPGDHSAEPQEAESHSADETVLQPRRDLCRLERERRERTQKRSGVC